MPVERLHGQSGSVDAGDKGSVAGSHDGKTAVLATDDLTALVPSNNHMNSTNRKPPPLWLASDQSQIIHWSGSRRHCIPAVNLYDH